MISLLVLAFLAGILTILSPCIVPVLPGVLGGSLNKNTKRPLAVVLGIIFGFTIFGTSFAVFINFLGLSNSTIRDLSSFLLLLFGLAMLFPLAYEKCLFSLQRFRKFFFSSHAGHFVGSQKRGRGGWSGFVLGLTLGAAWTPCAGPILGAILTLAARTQNVFQSGVLFFVYSLGVGIPLLLLAYGGRAIFLKIKIFSKNALLMKRIAGAILIILAIAIFFGWDRSLQANLIPFFPNQKL